MPRKNILHPWIVLISFVVSFLLGSLLLKDFGKTPAVNVSQIQLTKNGVLNSRVSETGSDEQADVKFRDEKSNKEKSRGLESKEEIQRGAELKMEIPVVRKECNPTDPRQIILLTYGRSGSTLTSDIISMDPSVFSYYEPLHNLAQSYGGRQSEFFKKEGKHLRLTDITDYNMAAVRMVEKLMTCNYHRLNKYASLNFHATRKMSTTQLYFCILGAKTPEAEEWCLFEAQKRCAAKPIKFLKVIRMAVKSLIKLMDAHPCMKILYLVRDPRGSYYSKRKTFSFQGNNTILDAKRFCARVNKDVDDILMLKKKYPDRVMLTRYENIAMQPIISTKRLYQFVGLTFTRWTGFAVYAKTHSRRQNDDYNTNRINSTAACYKWRDSIPYEYVKAFDNYCKESNYKLGYLPVNSLEEIRNQNFQLLFPQNYLS